MTPNSSPKHLTIGWLYGAKMNIYGDRGNVVTLEKRARWRGIDVTVVDIGIGDPIPEGIDIFFWGGGQDGEQMAVARDMQGEKAAALRDAIENGAAMLAICGGYQLLGKEYRPFEGDALPGIGVFDMVTVAGPTRFTGNIAIESDTFGELVGFENHSGLTTLQGTTQPLGKVRAGHGNNGVDGTEGAVYKNVIGCYLHGALLPKNPRLADWLLIAGLRHRYGETIPLDELDDTLEIAAHKSAWARSMSLSGK